MDIFIFQVFWSIYQEIRTPFTSFGIKASSDLAFGQQPLSTLLPSWLKRFATRWEVLQFAIWPLAIKNKIKIISIYLSIYLYIYIYIYEKNKLNSEKALVRETLVWQRCGLQWPLLYAVFGRCAIQFLWIICFVLFLTIFLA